MITKSAYALRLDNYIPLIAKLVHEQYAGWPQARRNWTSPEDLIHDAVVVVKTDLLPYYDARRARFTTILTIFVKHHLINCLKASYRKKRDEGFSIPIDDIRYLMGSPQKFELDQPEDPLYRVYHAASPKLKTFMQAWFFQERTKRPGLSDKAIKTEFHQLANRFGVTLETCREFFTLKADGRIRLGVQ